MPGGWRVFMIEPSPYVRRLLRRFTWSDDTLTGPCPVHKSGHNQVLVVEPVLAAPPFEDGLLGRPVTKEYEGDPRWPAHCPCGYKFKQDDQWQGMENRLFWGSPDGRLYEPGDVDLPVGACWEAPWFAHGSWVGPDGRSFCVQLPSGREFAMDGPASNNPAPKGWTRVGTPPFFTIRPSILQHGGRGYHGFIDNGVLSECYDGHTYPDLRRTGDDPDYLECARKGAAATAAERCMGTAFIEEISPGIWQSNAEGAMLAYRDAKVREARRIGGIVNVAWDVNQEYPGLPSLRLHLNDDLAVAHEDFDRAVAFQKKLSGENKATLVHCRMAINRSSTVIAAMMVAWGMTVDQALGRLPRKPYTQIMYDSLRSWAAARGR